MHIGISAATFGPGLIDAAAYVLCVKVLAPGFGVVTSIIIGPEPAASTTTNLRGARSAHFKDVYAYHTQAK